MQIISKRNRLFCIILKTHSLDKRISRTKLYIKDLANRDEMDAGEDLLFQFDLDDNEGTDDTAALTSLHPTTPEPPQLPTRISDAR